MIELLQDKTDAVIVEPNFISASAARTLADAAALPAAGRFDARLLDAAQDSDEIRLLGQEMRASIARTLEETYGLPKLYCDYLTLHAIGPDKAANHHDLHADCVKLDGTPNHTPRRIASALVYLTTQGVDFEGGSLHFEHLDPPLTVVPEAGLFVGFRGDLIHAHRVDPVTSGVRKTLAMWFSPDPDDEEHGW